MKCFICSLYYSCVLSRTGIVWFTLISPFLNLRYQKAVSTLSDGLSSKFLTCVCMLVQAGEVWDGNVPFWWTLSLCGIAITLQCNSDSQTGSLFLKYSDVCLWWYLTHGCTAFPGEPSVAGDQILLRVSQGSDFLDGTVSTYAQRTSAESRK